MRHIFHLICGHAPIYNAQTPRITELTTVTIPYLKDVEISTWRYTNTRNPVNIIFYTFTKNRGDHIFLHDLMSKCTINT